MEDLCKTTDGPDSGDDFLDPENQDDLKTIFVKMFAKFVRDNLFAGISELERVTGEKAAANEVDTGGNRPMRAFAAGAIFTKLVHLLVAETRKVIVKHEDKLMADVTRLLRLPAHDLATAVRGIGGRLCSGEFGWGHFLAFLGLCLCLVQARRTFEALDSLLSSVAEAVANFAYQVLRAGFQRLQQWTGFLEWAELAKLDETNAPETLNHLSQVLVFVGCASLLFLGLRMIKSGG